MASRVARRVNDQETATTEIEHLASRERQSIVAGEPEAARIQAFSSPE